MKISVSIMAHPKRRQEAVILLEKLKKYPFVKSSITWDQKNGEWDTGKRALEVGINAGGDYHVVLQDDAILPPDFYNHLENALKTVPLKSLISLYTGTGRPLGQRVTAAVAKAKNVSWLRSDLLYWGVGIAMPTSHIVEVLDFVADRTEVYDFRIGWAYMRNRLPVFYTNPSLVDHDDAMGSLLKQSALVSRADYEKVPRVAHNFIGDRTVNWNNAVLDI